jgi:hypothetical protein
MKIRSLVIGTITTAAGGSAALLGYLLFVGRRNLVSTGDANLQRWVGPDASRWIYLLIIAVLAGLFVVASVLSSRPAGPVPAASDRAWRYGAVAGGLTGLILGLPTLATGGFATTTGVLTATTLAAFGAALLGPALAGGWGAARTGGSAGSGALAGLWFGVALAVVAGFAMVLRDTVFADRLVSGAWLQDHFTDPTCNGQTSDTLAACELGDSFGAMASYWLLFPLLGAGLGAVGGLVGRAAGSTPPSAVAAGDTSGAGTEVGVSRRPLRTSVGLAAVLFVVFVLEASFKIW